MQNRVTSSLYQLHASYSRVVICFFMLFLFSSSTLFANPIIEGDTVVCKNALVVYTVSLISGNTYVWELPSGGTILQSNSNEITIDWNLGAKGSGPHTLKVTETDPTGNVQIDELQVWIQKALTSCEDQVNTTLDQNGARIITSEMLLTGSFIDYDDFEVNLSDQANNQYGNTATCDHIGVVLIAKVTNTCDGNVCWSEVLVEDKKGPLFDCPAVPIEIHCDVNYTTYPAPSVADNCDVNPLVLYQGETVDNSNSCDGVWVAKSWTATDQYGNSSSCEQIIHITSPDVVDFPKDTIWACTSYNEFSNITNPTSLTGEFQTTGSGVPGGVNGLYCNYNFNHTDDTLSACGNTFKILRTWFVFNWCTGEIVLEDNEGDDHEQLIEVIDNQIPIIDVTSLEINANVQGALPVICRSTGWLPPPIVTDNCSEYISTILTPIGEVDFTNGVDAAEGGTVPLPGLPIGSHFVTYRVVDICGNVSEKEVLLKVVDNEIPNVICDAITDVNLTSEGTIEILGEVLDDGSYDNCCIDRFEIKRENAPDFTFAASVLFDCSDAIVPVVCRVFDCAGNFNDCYVEIQVQDKILPLCAAPATTSIGCTALPAGLQMDDFATLTSLFGAPETFDNCSATINELPAISELDCGGGTITRYFEAIDIAGNVSGTCHQIITVEAEHNWELHFPADWQGGCGADADVFELEIVENGCDMFAVTVEDQLYNVANDSTCMQILRVYHVINWCNYVPNSEPIELPHQSDGWIVNHSDHDNYGYYTYQQIIWITDPTPPTIHYLGTYQFCSNDANCGVGAVNLPAEMEDDCTDDLTLTFALDLERNGSLDAVGNDEFFGDLPIGKHRIIYRAMDGCGNEAELEIDFEVIDCEKPVAVCENGLIIEIMQTGMVEVWAEDLNYGSYDNCAGDLIFSFSFDTNEQSQIFDCQHIDNQQIVEIWVTDAAGNTDFCETFIDVQDNLETCDAVNNLMIAGVIETEQGLGVENAMIELNSTNNTGVMTDIYGNFELADLQMGQDYTVTPQKNDNPLNGVTTFDLVVISKHVLEVEKMESPYKIIAADVNRSGTVSTFDLVELRRLILKVQDDFSNNTSWRFIAKDYEFDNPQNPFAEPFSEVIGLNNLNTSELAANFIAIKIGDVNDNALPNDLQAGDDRGADGSLVFATDNVELEAGVRYQIPIKAKNFTNILGFQGTLRLDPNLAKLVTITPISGVTRKEQFGLTFQHEGQISFCWHHVTPVSLPEETTLFILNIEALSTTELQKTLEINSGRTKAEAYQITDGEVLDLDLNIDFHSTVFQVFQNHPNPFREETQVGFYLPEAGMVRLRVLDAIGKVLYSKAEQFNAGKQELILRDLEGRGVLFLEIEMGEKVIVKRMVRE